MYKTILLAYDGSREGRAALREGAELAQRCGAAVRLLAVVHASPGMLLAEGADPSGLMEAETEEVRQILEEGLEKLRQRGLDARATLREGDPVDEIVAMADAVKAELIVLGHHRLNALARWWRGSVGEAILARAPCSLLIAVNGE